MLRSVFQGLEALSLQKIEVNKILKINFKNIESVEIIFGLILGRCFFQNLFSFPCDIF